MAAIRPRVMLPETSEDGRKLVSVGSEDTVLSAIVKWIPVEVIAACQFVLGVIPKEHTSASLWLMASFLPITALWIGFATREHDRPIAWRQLTLATFAFFVWGIGAQAAIVHGAVPSWEAWMGSIALALGGVLLPIGDGILRALGVRQN